MGWVNFWMPKVGLGGNPVGTPSARASGEDSTVAEAAIVNPKRTHFFQVHGSFKGTLLGVLAAPCDGAPVWLRGRGL